MKRLPIVRLLILAAILPTLTGCIFVHKHEEHSRKPDCKLPVVYVNEDPVITEIRAVHTLDFSSERTDHLRRIAARPGLSPDAQACLVGTTFRVIDFENEKMSVLHTLIDNPSLTSTGKSCILSHLGDLNFSSNRKTILDALDKHGPVVDYIDEPVVYEEEVVIELPQTQVQDSNTPKAQ